MCSSFTLVHVLGQGVLVQGEAFRGQAQVLKRLQQVGYPGLWGQSEGVEKPVADLQASHAFRIGPATGDKP